MLILPTLLILAIPLTLSAILWGIWRGVTIVTTPRKNCCALPILNAKAEGVILVAMTLPMVIGILICVVPPESVPALPDEFAPAFFVIDRPRADLEKSQAVSPPVAPNLDIILAGVWVIYGAGLLRGLLGLGLSHFYLRGLIRDSRPCPPFSKLLDTDGSQVRVTEAGVPPLVTRCGIILVPRALMDRFDQGALAHIIEHERSHWRRGDPRSFFLFALLARIFWYNPFVHEQISRCRMAAELACDRDALTHAPRAARKAYARALLQAARYLRTAPSTQMIPLETVPCFISRSHKGEIEMRLKHVMTSARHPSDRTRRLVILISSAGLVASAAFGASAQITLADAHQNANQPAFSVSPLVGKITSRFGMRPDPISKEKKFHRGTDIIGTTDDPVYAPAAGRVVAAEFKPGYGNLLTLDHGNGYVTRYGQLNSFAVRKGEQVPAGALIGRVGATGRATGPHLHLELLIDGEHADPQAHLILGVKAAPAR